LTSIFSHSGIVVGLALSASGELDPPYHYRGVCKVVKRCGPSSATSQPSDQSSHVLPVLFVLPTHGGLISHTSLIGTPCALLHPAVTSHPLSTIPTAEHDTEHMQKHSEDLNTTLTFTGLFSAVSSAFVINIQSKLQPNSGEQSEAYLRTILLNINQSIAPDETPCMRAF